MKLSILHIETSTEVCAVCLSQDREVLSLKKSILPTQHSSELTLLIQDCLNFSSTLPHQLNAIAVSSGPGSYTGLRVGVSVAKGMCYALGKPLLAVDTLKSLGTAAFLNYRLDAFYIPMLDAGRDEVYMAVYDDKGLCIQPTEAIRLENGLLDSLKKEKKPIIITGNGARKAVSILNDEELLFHPLDCCASFLVNPALELFQKNKFSDLMNFSPFYLKPPNITHAKRKL
jgi:tRNA threonylcarbamoyladenosine biosynthesis protein TsaB